MGSNQLHTNITNMLYTHTIGRIGKDCQVITGNDNNSFIAMDIAVDDYAKGKNVTTWLRVCSSKENHIRLSEYLTKGRMVLVEGTLYATIWEDRNGRSHVQLAMNADSIAFVNAGKKSEKDDNKTKAAKGARATRNKPEPPKDAPKDKAEDMPF